MSQRDGGRCEPLTKMGLKIIREQASVNSVTWLVFARYARRGGSFGYNNGGTAIFRPLEWGRFLLERWRVWQSLRIYLKAQ